ncbi:aromatic acid exporter family protein [uncultured Kocuria sp.]|uniref:FUSC family protein n=1 Tax=uncultured Kocuria sp. TaxID=259305 RepID=UPI002630F829|nr:FUSC family protein [uncultured Kocuria sp.]
MQTIRGARILLALKTSLAVALSWVVAQRMPGVIDDYPYYAPLGAISAMYPTVLGSVRAGLQTVAGIALGIMLAAGVLLVGDPNLVTVSVAVGLGVLLAGVRQLGAGAEYVPVGALFVLIVGGQDAEGFSAGFLVQMSVGVAIGLLVNVTVIPPLDFRTARLQLDRLQNVVVDYLEDVAGELAEPGTTGGRDWRQRNHALVRITGEVREAVDESARSARGNPRMMLRRRRRPADSTDPGYDSLLKLENVIFHLRGFTDAVRELYDHQQHDWLVPVALSARLAEAVQSAADAVRAWADSEDPEEAAERVRSLVGRLHADLTDPSRAEDQLVMAAAQDLARLVAVLDPPTAPTAGSSAVTRG